MSDGWYLVIAFTLAWNAMGFGIVLLAYVLKAILGLEHRP